MAFAFKLSLLVLSLITALHGVNGEDIIPSTTYCYDGNGRPTRCEPPRNSFSLDITPNVNSTCGNPPTGFCFRQIDRLRQVFSSDCTGVCNASDPQLSHPPELMTDFLLNEESWWQSENSLTPEHVVSVDMTFGTMVEISVIAFNFISPLPSNFYILKSNDYGETYVPFHYFSSSCSETYGIDPDQILNLDNETSILCQAIPYPPTQGLISFFPAIGRPSNNDSIPGFSEELYNFITATNIRILFVENYPINNLSPEDFGYYYAIEDLSIIGSCQCHGHAASCLRDPLSGTYQCECEHNTTGIFCERCADLYQDIPWQRADGNIEFECQACNCNNHSSLCVFNETVYEANGRTSGGVCVGCLHNTVGRQCEACVTYYYPRQEIPFSSPNACTACDCNPVGVTNDGDCVKESSTDGVQVGDCFCKENVFGRTCSDCIPGFFNLSLTNQQGCQACECNDTGSTSFECDALTGQCDCKPNIVGAKCDLCSDGFYMPNASSSDGCQACNCNPGGSLSVLCDMYSGQCPCQPGLTGQTCADVIPGYFFPSVDHLILEAENAAGAQVVTSRDIEGMAYHLVTDQGGNITFGQLTPPASGFYDVVIRYDLEGILTWSQATLTISPGPEEGDGATVCEFASVINETVQVNFTSWPMGFGLSISRPVCLQGGRSYTFELRDFNSGQMNSTAILRIDSLVLFFVNSSTLVEQLGTQTLMDYAQCASYFRSLSTSDSADPSCEQTIFTVSTALYSGAQRCNCSVIGSQPEQVCAEFGGQCPCLSNITGLQCDQCVPGFHSLSTSGCSACNCNPDGSNTDICDSNGGACDCQSNVVGQNCSECAENYWGLSPGEGCRECSCNVTGAVSLQCDTLNGLCNCKTGIEGANCDSCQYQHYGFSQTGCRPCQCSMSGSLSLLCSNVSGQCDCKRNVEGRDCSQCIAETFNLQQSNPHGCQPCFCSGVSNTCASASGYTALTVTSQFNETTNHGWISTDNETDLSLRTSAGIVLEPDTASYLQAPPIFLDNKLSSYNQYITVAIDSSNMTVRTTILPADVVLCSMQTCIGVNFSEPLLHAELNIFQVHLHETMGWTDMATNLPIDSFSLQLVLSSLDNLYVTVSYDEPVAINAISLNTVQPITSITDDQVSWVEQCSCPLNYEGFSCEQCAEGYTRSSNGSCELCQCNGFSETCDSETGICTDCRNSTTGDRCEVCQTGTYGNPLQQIPCQPCPCPLPSQPGQFSTNCSFSQELNDVVCFDCPRGHTGLQCESCISGFFGDPTGQFTGVPTTCSDCLCNGNIDFDDPNACDTTSGLCLLCLNNTAGDQCEVCAEGYYGDAVYAKNCSVCDCDPRGSNTSACDRVTGVCICYPNVVGRRCDECADGHFGYGSRLGCLPCNCHLEGAESNECDMSGQCLCKPGVSGLKCDQCIAGYYGLSPQGCTDCSCEQSNSLSVSCDATGQCPCRPGSTGRDCRQCILNYFQSNDGCTICPDCYQEIERHFLQIQTMFNSSLEQLQRTMLTSLGNETVQFSDQLDILQEISMETIELVNNSLARYNVVLTQYEDLVATINQTLLSRVSQIEVDLGNMRRISTTVLVLASTSEELMSRTISGFVDTQQLIRDIQSTLLLNITQTANATEVLYNFVHTIEQEILSTEQLLSSQIAELRFVVNAALTHSLSAVNTMYSVQDLARVIEFQYENIETISTTLTSAIQSLESEVAVLLTNITILMDLVRQQLTTLPNYDSLQESLNSLITNASFIETHATSDVGPEIENQFDEFSKLNLTLSLNIEEFNKLVNNLTIIVNKTIGELLALSSLETLAEQTISSTLATINLAQEVLQQLRNFSSDSQSIAFSTRQAAEAAENIKLQVVEIENIADNITADIELASADLERASQVTLNAANITRETKEVASALNLSDSLLSMQLVERNEDSIEGLVMNASHVSELQNNLANYSSMIDEAEMSTEDGIALSTSLQKHNSTATERVKNLEADLSALYTLTQNITAIQLFIERLDQTLSDYDILMLYQQLQNMLSDQETMRQSLETSLQSLQEQVLYLEHVNSLLPERCT